VTEDDRYAAAKQALCAEIGARYVVLPKTPPQFPSISTTEIVRWNPRPQEAPLRVDFAGGWLRRAAFRPAGRLHRQLRDLAHRVAAILALRTQCRTRRERGVGPAHGKDGVDSELDLGVGWQDPAVIAESGLCVWRSGRRPDLELKTDGAFLRGRMAGILDREPALDSRRRQSSARLRCH